MAHGISKDIYSSHKQNDLVGGWAYPSEKYESQLGLLFSIYGKIKHVPNRQPVIIP